MSKSGPSIQNLLQQTEGLLLTSKMEKKFEVFTYDLREKELRRVLSDDWGTETSLRAERFSRRASKK